MKATIQQILNIIDETKDATDFTAAQKIRWIAEAEAAVVNEVISNYIGYREEYYNINYDENTDRTTKLIAPLPYARIYEFYVKAQVDYARDELELYQNDLAQYTGAMQDFWKYYNQRHEHKYSNIEV